MFFSVVEFACEDDMKRAIRKLDGTELMGKRVRLSEVLNCVVCVLKKFV